LKRKNLWAPWRINYLRQIEQYKNCFICHYIDSPDKDDENFVLWRTPKSIVMLNRFPYNNGHLLIAPKDHIADLDEAGDDVLLELMKVVRDAKKVLTAAVSPHGFNVGINFGRCSGAGLPGHVHIHVVPRWDGDTNFMHVCSDTDVISQSLTELLVELKEKSKQNGLPAI